MAPLKVIGAGYGRTGTLSLCHALETLGYSCHHMQTMILDPTQNPDIFAEAYETRAADWDQAFKNYDAAVDWPASAFWPQLIQQYPDAKVILTVRESESWYTSASKTIKDWPMDPNTVWPERLMKARKMARTMIRDGELKDFSDKKKMIAQLEANTERVKRLVPPERLLIFKVSDGWEPLCKFLGKEVPHEMPFPRSNRGEDFMNRFKWLKECIENQENNAPLSLFEPDVLAMQNAKAY